MCRSDDRLISRLAFAVTGDPQNPTVLLRTRPSRLSPPEVILKATAFRSYLKIPNLFVPVDQRLHPPLRREAVVKLLVSESDSVHWLLPQADGSFVPQSVPDLVFRPLEDWVDYVLDNQHEPLEAWIQSHRFDFESFVCGEAKPLQPKPKKADRPKSKTAFEIAQSSKKQTVNVKPGKVKKPAKFDATSSLLDSAQ